MNNPYSIKLNETIHTLNTRADFESMLDKEVRCAKRILTIGETNMNFAESYATQLSKFRLVRLMRLNKNQVHIDIVEDNIYYAKLLFDKWDFRCIDIENKRQTKSLGKFDLIIMLDVIEHLSNTGNAMNNLRELLVNDGRIIITTDSPFYIRQFVNRLFRLPIQLHEDHTCFITPEHMNQICKRAKLILEGVTAVHFVETERYSPFVAWMIKIMHWEFVDQYVYVVRK